MTDETEVDVEE